MSKALNARLIEMTVGGRLKPLRYPILSLRTLWLLLRFSGKHLFVMNPSLLLALMSVVLLRLRGKKVIVDCHSAGLEPFEGKYRILSRVARFIVRNANVVIVTNEGSARLAREMGGNPFVMPDPILLSPRRSNRRDPLIDESRFNVMFICTWSPDEPYEEVFEAFRAVSDTCKMVVTGNPRKVGFDADAADPSLSFPGFLPEDRFHAVLSECDIVIDLTTRDNCLVCGAYEAIGCERPIILSDWPVNRTYFSKGAVYTENSAGGIAQSLRFAVDNLSQLKAEVKEFRADLLKRDRRHAANLQKMLAA